MDTQIQFLAELNQLMDKLSFLSRDQLKVALKGYKAAEVHTIEFIGQHPDTNATTIADALYVTRGAVSKMTKRLIDRGLITRYQKPDNQKETYFQLTQQGQTIFATHERLTRQFMRRDMPVFDENPQEVAATLNFLHEYNQFMDQQVEQQK